MFTGVCSVTVLKNKPNSCNIKVNLLKRVSKKKEWTCRET